LELAKELIRALLASPKLMMKWKEISVKMMMMRKMKEMMTTTTLTIVIRIRFINEEISLSNQTE
jgi:hypothetical protein